MKLLASSIPEGDRSAVVLVAAQLAAFSILQAISVASSTVERVIGALVYFAGAVGLVRNWHYSRNIALVLVFLITVAALLQLFFSALGVATPPVPTHDYVALAIAIVVLVLAVPALIWLWRYPRKHV